MSDKRWLILDLEAPLIAFGGVTIDHVGVIRDFPAASMLTGLFANALGYRRTEADQHQALQDRLVFAARLDRIDPAGRLTDMQNAQLEKSDRGWTTWGTVEERGGNSYAAPHRRKRDYHMDALAVIAVRLEPEAGDPMLGDLAEALERPARPLFIGRTTCLPARPLLASDPTERFVMAADAHAAISLPRHRGGSFGDLRACWPYGEGPDGGDAVHRIHDLADLRNWRSGLHGGVRPMVEGTVRPEGATP